MKKTMKMMLAFVAGALALSACSENDILSNNTPNTNSKADAKEQMTFTASQENDGSTRAVVDATTSTQIDWQTTDHISVFDATSNNDFTVESIQAGNAASAIFTGTAATASNYTALYPYQSGAALSSGDITGVTLPATQTATPNSFDPAAALMMGVSTGEAKEFDFKNVVAFIKVTTEVPAKSIQFSSYNCEDVAGTVTLSYNSGAPTATVTANGTHTVTLAPPTGETTIAAGTYYIAVLPQSLPFGFVLSYVDADGVAHNRVSNKDFTSTRNKVTNMGAINAGNTYTNRQIVYYASSQFDFTNSGNIISTVDLSDNTYVNLKNNTSSYGHTFSNGVGVLTFSNDIVKISNMFAYDKSGNKSSITKVILPETLTSLDGGAYSFYKSSIKELYLPKSVNTLYTSASDFIHDMPELEKILLPKNAPIQQGMIYNCPKLKYIYGPYTTAEHDAIVKDNVLITVAGGGKTSYTIPNGVTQIGRAAFGGSGISGTVTIPKRVTSIGNNAFYEAVSITDVVFEEGFTITSIPKKCFCWCGARVVIPNSVTSIGYETFYAYNATQKSTSTDIVIPDNVTTIETSAFAQSYNIESIKLGVKVASIGAYAFAYYKSTSNLKYIYSKNPTPPTLQANTFEDTTMTGVKIYVPTASVDAYKAADVWKDYASQIEGYNF